MRTRLKLMLPAIQVVIAALLLTFGNYQKAAHRGDVYYQPPARLICYALNAPAVLLRFAGMYSWDKAGRPYENSVNTIDNAIFLLAVSLVWYVIGAVTDSRIDRRRSIVNGARASRLRLGTDLALMLPAVAFILLAYLVWDHVHWGSMPLAATEAALYGIWGLALLIICGRDFIMGVSANKSTSE